MWHIDEYYQEKTKPIIKDAIIDYLDLGNNECPLSSDLTGDYEETLAMSLFFSDYGNYEAISSEDIKVRIVQTILNNNEQESHFNTVETFNFIAEEIMDYYSDAISELLHFEFEEIYNEYHDGLREEYEYDKEC